MTGFSELMTDSIVVLKADGAKHENLMASVQSDQVFLDRPDILVEPGDLIQRIMSNGGKETYKVIDPGFHEKFAGLDAHYQMRVKKLGIPEAKQAVQSLTVNISGPNARLNASSVDQSVNIAHINPDVAQHIAALRDEIKNSDLSESKQSEALELTGEIEGQFAGGAPKKSVLQALVNALPAAGNIASIGSLIVACL